MSVDPRPQAALQSCIMQQPDPNLRTSHPARDVVEERVNGGAGNFGRETRRSEKRMLVSLPGAAAAEAPSKEITWGCAIPDCCTDTVMGTMRVPARRRRRIIRLTRIPGRMKAAGATMGWIWVLLCRKKTALICD